MILDYFADRDGSLDASIETLNAGGLVVLPTDTVYGIGCDPFNPEAVNRLLAAKGRGRQMPPPVLVESPDLLTELGNDVPSEALTLATRFWPGALTIIIHVDAHLTWDLGETGGTVALRMPDNPVALALLRRFGPMAVTSANLTGEPSAQNAQEAYAYFGDTVGAYLDGGPTPGPVPSTIVDATHGLRIIRHGVITDEELLAVVPSIDPGTHGA